MAVKSFSPEQLATIVGVSQSSIKRWVDAGRIDVTRTAGGHRRISQTAALAFIRANQMRIERPDLLGIADLNDTRHAIEDVTLSAGHLQGLLESGSTGLVRQAITSAFLSGTKTYELFDGPIRDALAIIGSFWKTDQKGIYIEHSSTVAVIETISQLAALIGEPDGNSPLAIGAAPAGDPHIIPSLMASTVLREAGWRATNLGPNTPLYAIRDAVASTEPKLVWLAVKSKLSRSALDELFEVCERLVDDGVVVVAGGTEVERTAAEWPSSVKLAYTMSDLSTIAAETREHLRL